MDTLLLMVTVGSAIVIFAVSYYFGWPLMRTVKKMNEWVNLVRGDNENVHSVKDNLHWIDKQIEEHVLSNDEEE